MPDLLEALSTDALDERQTMTRNIMKIQRDQAPGIILYNMVRFDAVGREVSGFKNTFGSIAYDELTLR
jgi:ABC-type transport system substrate-binding protein